ncbi:MAG TPA: acetylglutamate kinase [Actinocrinis sp.]|jgi:acetylglutamate kinase|uniref:acetylglutamate kinase n=1 Tax=Actinocrinis sp. TaxID=1920516 RepID=UPI002D54E101|nr:acetylglutamate kinase [Actinocrinis sp.]HZU58485.1 acetylglutamate kinase [Actinocrinis sp.]
MKITAGGTRSHEALSKAQVLTQALPWLSRFHGATVVVKFGGNAMIDEALKAAFAQDVVFLRYAGLRPVVVHGGGPQISRELEKAGLESTFTAGLRVTTPEAMEVVRMVLTGQVQREIVGLVNAHGSFAVGISGEDGNTLLATRRLAEVDGEQVDIGRVGDVAEVDATLINALLDDGRIPVVSSVARAEDGGVYNVNADTAAAALAVGLGAEKLVVLTDVEGLYADWPPAGAAGSSDTAAEVISQLSADELEKLLPSLSSGMAPKMEACLRAVRGGVKAAHVLDGRVQHSLLLEVFTDEGIGTMVVSS